MEIKTSNAVFFSPNENTKRLLRFAGKGAPQRITNYDFTIYKDKDMSAEFGPEDLVLLGTPTFYGRVPTDAADRFKNFKGDKTPAILVVTYGNRAYEDALVELYDLAKEQGFVPIAAIVAVGKHSILRDVADGRPTFDERYEAEDFVAKIVEKLEAAGDISEVELKEVPGNRPYRDYGQRAVNPYVNEKCIMCAHCAANCPVFAIPMDKPNTTDYDICIGCMRCVAVCPHFARYIKEEETEPLREKIKDQLTSEKKMEFYGA